MLLIQQVFQRTPRRNPPRGKQDARSQNANDPQDIETAEEYQHEPTEEERRQGTRGSAKKGTL